MKKIIFLLFAFSFASPLLKASETDSSKIYFENAFTQLKDMLEGKTPVSFEHAVFISENPFWNNKYSYESFKKIINGHLYFIEKIIAANDHSDTINFSAHVMANGRFKMEDIRYLPKEKKQLYLDALANWAIFKYITDTTAVTSYYHLPVSYTSNDPFGRKNWANSQVMNLLAAQEPRGNCFALAGFFKILSDRLNAGATICTAPQHIYIQHRDNKGDMYNVELATAGHPGDGVIQTLTYTTNEALMSGIALREYNDKESIGLCLVNLAKSYEHKYNARGDEFLLQCAELALKHDSLNLNALLLKQQVLDERVISYAVKNKINDLNRIKTDKGISATYTQLQKHLLKLYALGYRQMPLYMQQMILDGLSDEKNGSISVAKNSTPFTTIKVDPKDEQYWTLSHGAFQEVFVPKKFESYGHFIVNTELKNISSLDTNNQQNFLIDPVAFAYDFGARMYDARTGRFLSIDPRTKDFPQWSPYLFAGNNPIRYIDVNGEGPGDRVKAAKSFFGSTYSQDPALNQGTELRTGGSTKALKYVDCSELVCRVLKADDITMKVEGMRSGDIKNYLSDEKKFNHTTTEPQVGDIAVWDGHVGIVSGVDNDGKIKLTHAAGTGKGVLENKYHIKPEQYRSSTFFGYYRPKVETPDGKEMNTGTDSGTDKVTATPVKNTAVTTVTE